MELDPKLSERINHLQSFSDEDRKELVDKFLENSTQQDLEIEANKFLKYVLDRAFVQHETFQHYILEDVAIINDPELFELAYRTNQLMFILSQEIANKVE